MLIALYYLSQSEGFEDLVKPILEKLKSSEHLLKFLHDLSNFSESFCLFNQEKGGGRDETNDKSPPPPPHEEPPQATNASPTSGLASPFIEELLQSYFTGRK